MNRNVLVVPIIFIHIVANIFNFDFRFRGNDARLIEGTVLLGLLVTFILHVFQMQIKPMQPPLQQYIDYTTNNENSRLTLYKVILVKWNNVEYDPSCGLEKSETLFYLRPCHNFF